MMKEGSNKLMFPLQFDYWAYNED